MTDSNDLAEERTDYAEDRTLLANERTFAGWIRTGLGSIGVGVGFNALFPTIDPAWIAKAVATVFIVVGSIIVILAERRAARVMQRLHAHAVDTVEAINLRLIAVAICGSAAVLLAGIWFFI